MTLLSIARREMASHSRQGGFYWSRSAVGLIGVLICVPSLAFSSNFGSGTSGAGVFNGLMVGTFLLCAAACMFTADSLSSERRDGTLLLLLITRVSTLDVIVGKLASKALASLCALLVVIPVMMLPVLAGGVLPGFVFRCALALVNLVFLSLSLGLLASAVEFEKTRAAQRAVMLLAMVLFLPVILYLMRKDLVMPVWCLALASPISTMASAFDGEYTASPSQFWVSIGLVHALGWVALALTPGALKRQMNYHSPSIVQEAPLGADRRTRYYGNAPLQWLVKRQKGIRASIWAAVVASGLFHFSFVFVLRFVGPGGYVPIQSLVSLAFGLLTAALLGWACSRFLIQARRGGELEVLLTTPEGGSRLVDEQWAALWQLLLWPTLVMASFVALSMFPRLFMMSDMKVYFLIWGVLGIANVVASNLAICWLGIWCGLKSRNQFTALVRIAFFVRFLPHLVFLVWPLFGPRYSFYTILHLVILGFLVAVALTSRRKLRSELHGAVPTSFAPAKLSAAVS